MASGSMSKIPFRIANGVSKPAYSQCTSFLDLPGEIRNRIYDFVLKEDEPLRIDGFPPYSRHLYILPPALAGRYTMKSGLHLFETCRAIYHEASSRFFHNNTFVISKPHNCHDPPGRFIDIIGARWLLSLGSCIHALSKVILDLDTLCSPTCSVGYYTLGYWDVFSRDDALIEVHPLLHALWFMEVAPPVEVIQPKGEAYREFQVWTSPRSCCCDCDAVKITGILNALVVGQLELRKYGRMLGGVGIKRDGSAGAVHWAKITAPTEQKASRYPFTSELHQTLQTPFIASDGGKQLQLRPVAPTFNGLPQEVCYMVLRYAITPDTPISINLDTESRFPYSPHNINSGIYRAWKRCYFEDNRFSLSMSTTHSTSAFSSFGPLARILRNPTLRALDRETWKGLSPFGFYSIIEDCKLRHQKIFVTLNFDISLPIAVDRLRISILPLIMETSDTSPIHGGFITITHPKAHYGKIVRVEQRIPLRKLRYNVTTALKDFLSELPNRKDLRRPEVWINGLGKIVKITLLDGPPAPQYRFYDNDHETTVKDIRYKHIFCLSCHPNMFRSVFPFEDSAEATLNYLRYVLYTKDGCREKWCSTAGETLIDPSFHRDHCHRG